MGRGGDMRNVVDAVVGMRRQWRGGEGFDILHAWGLGPLTAAAAGWPGRIVWTPDDVCRTASIQWLKAIMACRDLRVVCDNATQRQMLIRSGIKPDCCHLIRPGADFARLRPRRDEELRRKLGFTPNQYVVLLVGESTRTAGHFAGIWAASILNELDSSYQVLLWGRGADANRVMRFVSRINKTPFLHNAQARLRRPVDLEDILPAADMVLMPATEAVPTLPICISMAAGVPIVAVASSTTAELLEDRQTAMLTATAAPRKLAERMHLLRSDSILQWALADRARAEAYEHFSFRRFLAEHRTLYAQVTVHTPPPAPHS